MYLWDEGLETGNELIDQQHKDLLNFVNAFEAACREGRGKADVEQAMSYLLDYTAKHFADEERIQREAGYPAYLEHRHRHREIKLASLELAQHVRGESADEAFAVRLCLTLGDLLLKHIRGEDFLLAEFLRARGPM